MIRRRYLNSGIRVPELSSGYLTFRALEDNVLFSASGYHNFYYSINYGNWKKFEGTTEFLNFNDIIEWVGDKVDSSWILGTFESTGNFEVYGNLLSLLGHNIGDEINIQLSFYELFKDSENLISVANLLFPSYTGENCYQGMFKNCTSLLEAPQSLGTNENSTLCGYCYKSMFEGCTSLIIPPTEITGLANQNTGVYSNYCCNSMFANCTSLTYSPIIKCHVASGNKFSSMFYGCVSLSEITCLDENPSSPENWVKNVASEGTFYKHPNSQWTTGNNGIPTGWLVVEPEYLTFKAIEDTTFTFTLNALKYSLDNGQTWTTLAANTVSPTVTAGNKILWKQTGLTPTYVEGIGTFSATGNFEISGNIMSLYYGDNFIGQKNLTGKNSAFRNLFNGNTRLVNAENLILPATTLGSLCYYLMFKNCTSLISGPIELPATTLKANCYDSMFNGCSALTNPPNIFATTLASYCCANMFEGCISLVNTPELHTVTLAESCYNGMFKNCTALTEIPELSATTLTYQCYLEMFWGCTSLTTAPELLATTLAQNCYKSMFYGCSSLTYIKCLATNISANSCISNWVFGVAASGIFVKADNMSSWTTGVSGIPSGWTVINASEETQN